MNHGIVRHNSVNMLGDGGARLIERAAHGYEEFGNVVANRAGIGSFPGSSEIHRFVQGDRVGQFVYEVAGQCRAGARQTRQDDIIVVPRSVQNKLRRPRAVEIFLTNGIFTRTHFSPRLSGPYLGGADAIGSGEGVTRIYRSDNVTSVQFSKGNIRQVGNLTQANLTRGLRPLTRRVGMEVTGVDLSSTGEEDIDFILEAFHAHGALMFRDQKLNHQALITFSGHFGVLDEAPPNQRQKAVPGLPEIYVVSNIKGDDGKAIGSLGSGEAIWHADMSNRENPPDATLLYAVEVPPTGGDTWVASMFAALDDMPDELREKIEGRSIKHDGTYNSGGYVRKGVEASDDPRSCAGTLHPAICAHSEAGRPVLYLGRRRNAYVDGLCLEESEALLDKLWAHATQDAYCYAHRWRKGDLLMWDNRSTLHRRDDFDPAHRRMMLRTQIKGKLAPRPACVMSS